MTGSTGDRREQEEQLPEGSKGRIVVGVDGSPASVEALRWAARMGALLGVGVDAVTVWEYAARHEAAYQVPERPGHPDDAARGLDYALVDAFGEHRPADLRAIVRSGHSAAKTLVELSADAELLVLGSRGHGGIVGVLLGSVSAACAAHASCPVTVVHEPERHASTPDG